MDDQRDLLTVKEAAQLLTIKESTLRDWVLRKKLPIVRVGEKLIRIRRSELLKLVVDETA
jgi:excisionase family DNA binding protein